MKHPKRARLGTRKFLAFILLYTSVYKLFLRLKFFAFFVEHLTNVNMKRKDEAP